MARNRSEKRIRDQRISEYMIRVRRWEYEGRGSTVGSGIGEAWRRIPHFIREGIYEV